VGASSAPASCPNGTYNADVGDSSPAGCSQCPLGQSCSAAFSTAGVACAAGTYASAFGQSACTACAAGTYLNSTGSASQCPLCQAGYYCQTPVQITACPANTNASSGSTSLLQCICLPGYMCDYYMTVTVTFLMPNVTVSDFNNNVNNIRTRFIASVASAAGVSNSSITIVSVTAASRRRNLLQEDETVLHIVANMEPPSSALEQHEHYVEHTQLVQLTTSPLPPDVTLIE
jgi:hypothetical protein